MAASGDGLRVQLSRIPGETARHVLTRPFGFPAVLDDFTVEEEMNHSDYSTIRYGQFSQPVSGFGSHGRNLQTLELNILAMDWEPRWMVITGVSHEEVRNQFSVIGRSKKPFRLRARAYSGANAPYELRMDATIRTVSRTLKHGELDTRYFTVSFTEWRDADVRRRSRDPGRSGKYHLPLRHKLTAKNTLHSLSKKYYATYGLWRLLRDRNGLSSRFGPTTPIVHSRKFKVGSRFLIPARPSDTTFSGGAGAP